MQSRSLAMKMRGLVDLFGQPVKDKGKKVAETDEQAERAARKFSRKEERKRRMAEMTPEERGAI